MEERSREIEINPLIENIDLITRKAHHSKFSDTFQKAVSRFLRYIPDHDEENMNPDVPVQSVLINKNWYRKPN